MSEQWIEKPIGSYMKLLSGFPFPSSGFTTSEGFPLIRIRDILDSSIGTYFLGKFEPQYVVQKGDVLVGMDGDFNIRKWKNSGALLNQRILKVGTLDPSELDEGFLFYWLQPFLQHVNDITAATTVKHLSVKDLRSAKTKLPSAPVQTKIGNILQTIDEAIEQTETLIEKYSLVKAGMMHDLFTRGLTPDGKLRPSHEEAPDLYKETPMGWIPKEWEYDLLDKSTDRRSGHTPSKSIPEYWNGGVKWVSLADSHRLDRLYIDDTDFEISTLGLQNSSAVLLPAGMVIMSRDAGIGKSAITTKPMAVSQHFMAWQCGDKMDKYFLYYWLQIKKRMFENIAMGSTILTIGLSYFKRLKIAAPSDLDEQEQIGKRLKQADTHLFSLEAELNKLKKQKSGLMHDLLTGEVPVNVEEPEVAHV